MGRAEVAAARRARRLAVTPRGVICSHRGGDGFLEARAPPSWRASRWSTRLRLSPRLAREPRAPAAPAWPAEAKAKGRGGLHRRRRRGGRATEMAAAASEASAVAERLALESAVAVIKTIETAEEKAIVARTTANHAAEAKIELDMFSTTDKVRFQLAQEATNAKYEADMAASEKAQSTKAAAEKAAADRAISAQAAAEKAAVDKAARGCGAQGHRRRRRGERKLPPKKPPPPRLRLKRREAIAKAEAEAAAAKKAKRKPRLRRRRREPEAREAQEQG